MGSLSTCTRQHVRERQFCRGTAGLGRAEMRKGAGSGLRERDAARRVFFLVECARLAAKLALAANPDVLRHNLIALRELCEAVLDGQVELLVGWNRLAVLRLWRSG